MFWCKINQHRLQLLNVNNYGLVGAFDRENITFHLYLMHENISIYIIRDCYKYELFGPELKINLFFGVFYVDSYPKSQKFLVGPFVEKKVLLTILHF